MAGRVRIQQPKAVQFVEESQHLNIHAVRLQAALEFAGFCTDQAQFKLIPAVIGRCQGLHIHDHVAVPVRPDGNGISFIAVLVRGADLLHLHKQIRQVIQVLHSRETQLLVQIPADVPGVEEVLMAARFQRYIVAKAMDLSVAALGPVGFQCRFVILPDIWCVFLREPVLLPVQEKSLGNRILVLVAIRAPDYDVAEVAALHAGSVGTVRIRNDVDPDIVFVQQQVRAPMALKPGIVCQLAVDVQGDRFAVIDADSLQPFVCLVLRVSHGTTQDCHCQYSRYYDCKKLFHVVPPCFFTVHCSYAQGKASAFHRAKHDPLYKVPLHKRVDQQDRNDGHHGDGVLNHPLVQHAGSSLFADRAPLAHHRAEVAG